MAAPFSFATHLLPAQYALGAQSESLAHDASHAAFTHKYGSHAAFIDCLQTPEPSQTIATTSLPVPHVAAPQAVPACAVWLHEPDPLHVPSGPHGMPGFVGQLSLCGFV
jgi:hypothetical protein